MIAIQDDAKFTLGRGQLQCFRSTTQLVCRVRLSQDRNTPLRVPVKLAEMFRRPRQVSDIRTDGMQLDDAAVGGGDYLAIDRGAPS